MLLTMVIISGFFMICSLLACGALATDPEESGPGLFWKFIQSLAWAFFFVVNLIQLVK